MGDQYYTFSSIMFYTNQDALLLNGRYFNLEYGSYAPGAPNVFIDDLELKHLGSATLVLLHLSRIMHSPPLETCYKLPRSTRLHQPR